MNPAIRKLHDAQLRKELPEFRAGDTIRTRCVWKNPTDAPISFGQETSDEMCYSFTVYYPRITVPVWSWAVPAALSSCQ